MDYLIALLDRMIDRINELQGGALAAGIGSWILLSFATGAIAQGKGHSSAYVLLSLFLSPLVGLLTVLGMRDRRGEQILALEARITLL